MHIAIIGGGAAGFFAAITAAEAGRAERVSLFERGTEVLQKVKVSGGGRCNVTHACFDPRTLTQYYPRGSRELLGPFMQFGPAETIEWFESRGVQLKTEADGRMFPVTDDSMTIVQCLIQSAREAGVEIYTGARVESLALRPDDSWALRISSGSRESVFDKLMIATGSNTAMWDHLANLGHTIVPPAPSLFTFNTKDVRLRELSGLSVPAARLRIPAEKLEAQGPLLITHWGLSGPAVLRLSAWGAKTLQDKQYKFPLEINWLGDRSTADCHTDLAQLKTQSGKKTVTAHPALGLPLRLWQRLVQAAGIPENLRWADVDKKSLQALAEQCTAAVFQITGKSTFKEEFVTAGGVSLKEINFKTFSSRILPNLYLAGEVLDIDAVTGGFNFQAAWTGGYLAGKSML